MLWTAFAYFTKSILLAVNAIYKYTAEELLREQHITWILEERSPVSYKSAI